MTIVLASESTRSQIDCRSRATRSGSDLVPAIIRDAGPQAVESYLCFFANVRIKSSASVYRSAAKQFLAWASVSGLSLQAIRSGHAASYLDSRSRVWKASSVQTNYYSLKKLFSHLEADRIVVRSPFADVQAPKLPQKPNIEPLKAFLKDLDGYEEGDILYRPGLVAMYPVVVGGMDEAEISRATGVPLAEVEGYVKCLRDNGLWSPEGKVVVDWSEDDESKPEFLSLAVIHFVLMIGCAAGVFKRVAVDPESPGNGDTVASASV